MSDYKIESIFNNTSNKMIYVYDFLKLWTFFVEYIGDFQPPENNTTPLLLFSLGNLPNEAPLKEFEPKKEEDEDNDDFDIFDGDDAFNDYY